MTTVCARGKQARQIRVGFPKGRVQERIEEPSFYVPCLSLFLLASLPELLAGSMAGLSSVRKIIASLICPAHLVGVSANADLAQAGDGDDTAVAAQAAGYALQGLVNGNVRREGRLNCKYSFSQLFDKQTQFFS